MNEYMVEPMSRMEMAVGEGDNMGISGPDSFKSALSPDLKNQPDKNKNKEK